LSVTFVSFVATWCGKGCDKSEDTVVPGLAGGKGFGAKCEDIIAKINGSRAGFTKFGKSFRLYSMTISKGKAMAPVGQTTSHCRHQPQSSVSMTVTTFCDMTRAWHRHTLIHSPQPLHFFWSICGISATIIPPSFIILDSGLSLCL